MREKTHRIPSVDENVFKKIGHYIIDLKYLNKHLFSKKKCFSRICKSTQNKHRIPLVDQKVIA